MKHTAKILRFPDGKDMTAERLATPAEAIAIRIGKAKQTTADLQEAIAKIISSDHKVDYNFEAMVVIIPTSESILTLFSQTSVEAADMMALALDKVELAIMEEQTDQ